MAESWWDDFSKNLATDLAPLIALLGESPTKQYLSECITWEDIVIFAAAPLGVITAVVSAIRVCGTPSLRAFIGRAQEGAGVAEAELCSSTSRDVCELYTNGGIARVFGRPKLLEVVHDPQAPAEEFFNSAQDKATAGIYSFQDYVTRYSRRAKDWKHQSFDEKEGSSGEHGADSPNNARFAPNPNLSLNIGIRPHKRFRFIVAAAWGVLSQLAVLIWAALARYYYQWTRNSNEDDYAVPMTVIGTILLCFGMGLCAYLVERKTDERVIERVTLGDAQIPTRMYWVQPGNQSIGDQIFDAFAYSDQKFPLQRYITSWKKTARESHNMTWIWTAVLTTSIGFVCQFLGLRACHSSVAVAQFGATILMSLVRASLRTQRLSVDDNLLKNNPDYFQGNELDFLALNMAQSLTRVSSGPEKGQLDPLWVIVSPSPSPPSGCHTTAAVNPDFEDVASGLGVDERSEFNVLETLPMVSSGLTILCGFRINSKLRNELPLTESWLMSQAKEDLLMWKLSEYCMEHEADYDPTFGNRCKHSFNAAITAVFYRERLARLTGSEQPRSEHSSHWGGRFVPVRETAVTLALAIEDTMQILFDSLSTEPVILCRAWQQALSIFWTLGCSLDDHSQTKDCFGSIHMSLHRAIDEKGAPKGPWKADRSELEAVLGLWTWSLKPHSMNLKRPPGLINEDTSRIFSSHEDKQRAFEERLDMGIWQEGKGDIDIEQLQVQVSDIDATRHGGGFIAKKRAQHHAQRRAMRCIRGQNAPWWKSLSSKYYSTLAPTNSNFPAHSKLYWKRQYFGWCNVVIEEGPQQKHLAVLNIESNDSILLNCAQEIYSIFLTAILNIVKDIGKIAVTPRQRTLTGTASNENIKRIQQSLIARGLCDEEAAFACTIPVFRRHGKLKLPDEILEMAGELADTHRSEKQWKELRELLSWMHHHSLADFRARRKDQNPTEEMRATNALRLSVLQLCATYNSFLLQDDDEWSAFGFKGILELVEKQSEEETYKSMPLIWRDCGELPNFPSSQPSNVADTIRCYGKAALWQLCCKDSLDAKQQQFRTKLTRQFPHQQDNFSESCAGHGQC